MADILKLKIASLLHDGRGIAFMPGKQPRGKAVFVAGALPGQTVVCQPVRERKGYMEAELLEIASSEWEDAAGCPHWHECGGCPLLPMPYDRQCYWKERLALDAMLRIGRLDEAHLRAIWRTPYPSPLQESFRNKVELAFGKGDMGISLGFRKRQGHAVFALKECRIMPYGAARIAGACQKLAAESGLPPYVPENAGGKFSGFWRFLVLRRGFHPQAGKMAFGALCITSPASQADRKKVRTLGRRLIEMCPDLACFIHEERKKPDLLAKGQRRVFCLDGSGVDNPAAAEISLNLADRAFSLDMTSFFQVNDASAQLLGGLALELDSQSGAGHGSLLDMYCGVGAPGQLLARRYDRVVGIESDARAIYWAKKNAGAESLGQYAYRKGDAASEMTSMASGRRGQWQTALLDPPRGGLQPQAIAALLRLEPDKIIYISCNAATLARDAALLAGQYEPVFLGGVDMFPQTPHLECCGLWRKRRAQ